MTRRPDRLSTTVMPQTPTTANVIESGRLVGTIERVAPDGMWVDFEGVERTGYRWLPTGLPHDLPGPHTRAEAALLVLALAGYDHEAAARSVGLAHRLTGAAA